MSDPSLALTKVFISIQPIHRQQGARTISFETAMPVGEVYQALSVSGTLLTHYVPPPLKEKPSR